MNVLFVFLVITAWRSQKENIDEVKILDQKVNHLLEQCRPTTVLSLIREGKNPLDMPIR